MRCTPFFLWNTNDTYTEVNVKFYSQLCVVVVNQFYSNCSATLKWLASVCCPYTTLCVSCNYSGDGIYSNKFRKNNLDFASIFSDLQFSFSRQISFAHKHWHIHSNNCVHHFRKQKTIFFLLSFANDSNRPNIFPIFIFQSIFKIKYFSSASRDVFFF